MNRCWRNGRAWALTLLFVTGATCGTSALAANDYSPAEQALFLDDHLGLIKPPRTLHYAYVKRGSLEPPFDDSVDVAFAAQPDGTCCTATTRFLDSTRGAPQPSIDGLHGNPVILYFLERDIHEMQRRTKGQPNYFRNRIRMSIYQNATIRDTERLYQGRTVPIREITVSPYIDDPLRARFERFASKQYVFELSKDVPGGVYAIETRMADTTSSEAPSLVTERLLLEGAEVR